MISDQVQAFLRDHPAGSRVRPSDTTLPVWEELVRLGYLAQLPGNGYGYQLVTYMVVPPASGDSV